MMFNNLVFKTLYDKKWSILAWSAGVFALNIIIVLIFPDFKRPELVEAFKNLPQSLQAFSGSLDIGTLDKYLDSQVFFNNGSIVFWILGISLGVNLLATDEDKGTLETTLATKVSRTSVYTQKLIAMTAIFLIVNVFSIIAILSAALIIGESINMVRLLQASFMLFLFTFLLGTFSLSVGAITGKKSLSIGIPTSVLVVMFLVYTFSQTVKWMKDWDLATWNYYYANSKTVINGIDYSNMLVLIISAVIFIIAGLVVFRKRDLS